MEIFRFKLKFTPDSPADPGYLKSMSAETAHLLAAFEALPVPEKQVFVKELFRRLPPHDSGPLDDDEVALAGDQLAAMLEQEENDAPTR